MKTLLAIIGVAGGIGIVSVVIAFLRMMGSVAMIMDNNKYDAYGC